MAKRVRGQPVQQLSKRNAQSWCVSQDRVEAEPRNCIEQQNRITDTSNQAHATPNAADTLDFRLVIGYESPLWDKASLSASVSDHSACSTVVTEGNFDRGGTGTCAPCDQRSRSPVRNRERERERESVCRVCRLGIVDCVWLNVSFLADWLH